MCRILYQLFVGCIKNSFMAYKFSTQFELLSKHQQSRFRLFLSSPYHNANSKMLLLFDALSAGKDDKQQLYKKLYPASPYNDLRLRRLLSEFGKLISQFLNVEAALNDGMLQADAELKAYANAEDEKLFNQKLQASRKLLEQSPLRDGEHYYQQYKLAENAYMFASKTQNRAASNDLRDTLQMLGVYNAITHLKYICEQVNRANVLNEQYEKAEVAQALTYISNPHSAEIGAIQLYHYILLTLIEPDNKEHYQVLKTLLQQYHSCFSGTETRDLYGFAQNYCIKKINGGDTGFLSELFELYQQLLLNRAILDNGQLSAYDYKNIVFVGLRLSEYAWIRNFIEQYKTYLPKRLQRDAYIYNLAYYHFFRKEYNETLEMLNTVRFRDVYYYLDSRSLLLKTFYELDEIDPLYSLIESASAYLRRNKLISEYQKELYQKLFKYVKRLVAIQGKPKAEKAKLLAKLEKETTVADKVWLRLKLQEISGLN